VALGSVVAGPFTDRDPAFDMDAGIYVEAVGRGDRLRVEGHDGDPWGRVTFADANRDTQIVLPVGGGLLLAAGDGRHECAVDGRGYFIAVLIETGPHVLQLTKFCSVRFSPKARSAHFSSVWMNRRSRLRSRNWPRRLSQVPGRKGAGPREP
jgi:hypothetical protein